jgi:hypothetical protein
VIEDSAAQTTPSSGSVAIDFLNVPQNHAPMRIAPYFIICIGLAGTAHANPVTLICNGHLTMDGKQVAIGGETAILDLEKRSFKPPCTQNFL